MTLQIALTAILIALLIDIANNSFYFVTIKNHLKKMDTNETAAFETLKADAAALKTATDSLLTANAKNIQALKDLAAGNPDSSADILAVAKGMEDETASIVAALTPAPAAEPTAEATGS
jgi:hypothetical protein